VNEDFRNLASRLVWEPHEDDWVWSEGVGSRYILSMDGEEEYILRSGKKELRLDLEHLLTGFTWIPRLEQLLENVFEKYGKAADFSFRWHEEDKMWFFTIKMMDGETKWFSGMMIEMAVIKSILMNTGGDLVCPSCGQISRIRAETLSCERCDESWPCPICGDQKLTKTGSDEGGKIICSNCSAEFDAGVVLDDTE